MTTQAPLPDSASMVTAVLSGVHLPLANAEFAIDQHLMSRGVWIDGETRLLLARLRDVLGEVAASTRRIAGGPSAA